MKFDRKKISLLVGTLVCSLVWILFTSSIYKQQTDSHQQVEKSKVRLVKSLLARLYDFNPILDGKELKKSTSFVFRVNSQDQSLIEKNVKVDLLDEVTFINLKRSFIDAGSEASFFILDLDEAKQFFVRVKKTVDETELVGFPLNEVLNMFSYDLGQERWFLTDSKGRILASDVKAYVGGVYHKMAGLKSYKVGLAKKTLAFSIMSREVFSLFFISLMGVLGVFLLAGSIFFYIDDVRSTAEGVQLDSTPEEFDKSFSLDEPVVVASHDTEPVFKEEGSEEMKIVDLSENNKKDTLLEEVKPQVQKNRLDYSNFLMENPILGEISIPNKDISREPAVEEELVLKTFKEDEIKSEKSFESIKGELKLEKDPDEWILLAEELSKNLDLFTEKLGKTTTEQSHDTKTGIFES